MRNKEQLEVTDEIGLALETIEDNIQDSYKKLHSIQSQDKEFRVQYLLEMAEKYASENDVTREAAVRDLMYHEELRDTFRKIQEKMSRQKSQQMIEVWLQSGEEKIVFDTSDEVEAHILQRNKAHLQQAYDTPFAGGAMGEYLDKHGDSDFANRVLEGEFLHEVQDGDPVMRAYLETLQFPRANSENSVETNITIQEYKKFWKKQGKQQ